MYIFLYLIVCTFIAVLGRKKRIGAWGFFLVSCFFTPIGGILILTFGAENKD